MVKAVYLVLLLFLFQCAHSQDFAFTRVQGVNGKPIGKINGITQDHYGYMWFVGNSERCLYRYDGSTITAFRHEENNVNSLNVNNRETVYADDQGLIWVGGDALDYLDPATGIFTHYRHSAVDDGSLSGYVYSILRDRKGRLWVGTENGLDLLDEKTGAFHHYRNIPGNKKSLSSNIARTLYEDRSGTLWVGTGFPWGPGIDGGLNRLEADGTFTRYQNDPSNPQSLISNKVSALFEDSRGVFWVGGDVLHTMDRVKGTFERILNDPGNPDAFIGSGGHISFISEDRAGAIWIGTIAAGINRYDPVTKKITHYKDSHGFPDRSSFTGFISRDGALWVATEDSHELFRVDPFYKPVTSIQLGTPATSFVEDADETLWVGTYGAGIVKYPKQDNSSVSYKANPADPSGLPGNNVFLFRNGGDTIWARTRNAVRILNKQTAKFYWKPEYGDLKDSISFGITPIIQDKRGLFWFGTFGKGLVRFNPKDNSFRHFLESEKDSMSISSNGVIVAYEDKSGTLWAGTQGGLNRVEKESGRFKHYMEGNQIYSLYQDSDGNLWSGTGNGLMRYDPIQDRFSGFLDPQSDISISATGGIAEDNEKNLWFNALDGIVRLNPVTRETYAYRESFGIFIGETLWANPFKNAQGELFFSHEKGFYRFAPETLAVKSDFSVLLTGLQINAQWVRHEVNSPLKVPVEELTELDLPYNQNNLTFHFAAMDYRNPEATRFFTRLDHYDSTWREAVGVKASFFFNVPPGDYVFRVKAINRDGTRAEKKVSILIHPPWWQTGWAYAMYILGTMFGLFAFVSARTKKLRTEKRILEERVAERTVELKKEKENVESTLSELKSTQAQLIQSEKMASLGELTAGIAHEIQNPLNFVNNFSEVNKELLLEMKEELGKGNLDEAKIIAEDVIQNQEKINHHGKRADAIVKGMLQHSRTSSGIKEPTDINALADEYLRLAYHGLRAKDKSFNASVKTDFDASIGKVNVIPQDIGRVVLNLITNAFYAVAEKKSTYAKASADKEIQRAYEPTVTVSTRRNNHNIEIRIRDNGNGIPQNALNKIFQPFFTTKPSGQGTGLGLSLSYDIIKAHGGELKVETKEGEFAEFIIQLPHHPR